MSQPEIKYDNFDPQPSAAFVFLLERKTDMKLEQALANKNLSTFMLAATVEPMIAADIVKALAQKPKVNLGYPLYCVVHQSTATEEEVKVSVYALAESSRDDLPA